MGKLSFLYKDSVEAARDLHIVFIYKKIAFASCKYYIKLKKSANKRLQRKMKLIKKNFWTKKKQKQKQKQKQRQSEENRVSSLGL